MTIDLGLDKCLTYIDCQLQTKKGPARAPHLIQTGPAITISRQTGSGAFPIAQKLAEFMQENDVKGRCPWTVFDRELVETVCAEHNLPKEFARFMNEDKRSYLDDTMEELLGLHPDSWTLARQTTETILHLAELGRVIVVGRGANIITAKMPNAFHARLVGSLERRTAYIQETLKLSKKEALKLIQRQDRGRGRYLQKNFRCDIEDPLLYHLVINTDRVAFDEAARVLGEAALRHFKACSDKEAD